MSGRMQQVVLRAYAKGTPKTEDFALETVDVPRAAAGQVLVRTIWL